MRLGTKAVLPVPTEHEEQRRLMAWIRLSLVSYPELAWLFAIPNQGGKGLAAIARGRAMKAEGLRPGYPDLGLDHARGGYHGLRIELKRRKFGALSGHQTIWLGHLQAEGFATKVCYGWEEARDALIAYLRLRKPGQLQHPSCEGEHTSLK